MRYDTPVYFQEITPGEYDPETGDYREDTIQETKRLASVMNTGEETLKLLYGSIKQGSLTILFSFKIIITPRSAAYALERLSTRQMSPGSLG